ncbi:MAG: endonuclease/exonuclease/phosphatase family protein [Methyloceanibacter sp.]|nr:endonuclease/exonuclease/phosphatase family protein [Methyloceanibacter sp.]
MPMRTLLNAAIIGGCLFAAVALVAGVMADAYPALDIVNNGLPFLVAGLVVLFALSLALRSRMLIVTTAALLAIAGMVLIPKLSGAAPQAPGHTERFMRVATFNMWGKGDVHAEKVQTFLVETDADVVVLEEIRWQHEDFLQQMQKAYPYQSGKHGLVILSKHPILDKGRLDRPDEPYWRSLIVNWARLNVNGHDVEVVGVHLARPFYPHRQQTDFENLTWFLRSRTGPVIVAGDFNAAPWTQKFHGLTAATGLKRLNTLTPTWPVRWRNLPLLPLLPIDNILISSELAMIDLTVAGRLESDHLPVVADLALNQ